MSLYDDLGVQKTADRATIKRAYRKKAQKLHPDRGGSSEKFHAVTKAYEVLYDDARRAHYDATGQDGSQDKQGELVRRLAALFLQTVEQQDVDHADIIVLMKNAVVTAKSNTTNSIKENEKRIAKYERAKQRLKKKDSGENIFAQILDGQISAMRRGIENGKIELEKLDEMLHVLAEYQYQVDAQRRGTPYQFVAYGLGGVFGQ